MCVSLPQIRVNTTGGQNKQRRVNREGRKICETKNGKKLKERKQKKSCENKRQKERESAMGENESANSR